MSATLCWMAAHTPAPGESATLFSGAKLLGASRNAG